MARISRKHDKLEVIAPSAFKVGAYVRLSVEDIRKKESDSVETQKQLISNYIEYHEDLKLYEFYEDVNATGMNFNRTGFLSLLEDAKRGKFNTIIVKDLSRFGRNFLEAGAYIEDVFPALGIRFISINDLYDSDNKQNDDMIILPIKNLMNEIFVRDISKKIKGAYQVKREKGEFLGSVAPYGFLLKEKKLIIDEEVIMNVQEIFRLYLSGLSEYKIAKILNEKAVLPPSKYKYEKGLLHSEKYKKITVWYKSTVQKILKNSVYRRILNESDCFRLAQKENNIEKGKYNFIHNIWKGIVCCKDCGRKMIRKKIGDDYVFLCTTYEQIDRGRCRKKKVWEKDIYKAVSQELLCEISEANIKKYIDKIEVDHMNRIYIQMKNKELLCV